MKQFVKMASVCLSLTLTLALPAQATLIRSGNFIVDDLTGLSFFPVEFALGAPALSDLLPGQRYATEDEGSFLINTYVRPFVESYPQPDAYAGLVRFIDAFIPPRGDDFHVFRALFGPTSVSSTFLTVSAIDGSIFFDTQSGPPPPLFSDGTFGSLLVSTTPIPEPSTVVLFVSGLLLLIGWQSLAARRLRLPE